MAEVAASNQFRETLSRLKRNIDQNRAQLSNGLDKSILEGVTFPEPGSLEIRADSLAREGSPPRGNNYSSGTPQFKYRTQLVSLFREFERLNSGEGITEADFERVMEGFLIGLRGTRFTDLLNASLESKKAIESYNKVKVKLNTAVGLYRTQIEKIKR